MSLVATVLNSTGLEDLNQVTFPLVIYMSVLFVLVNISIFFFIKSWQFDRFKRLVLCHFILV